MRIIDYYNYIAMAAYIIIGVAAIIIYKKQTSDPYYIKRTVKNPIDNPYVCRAILFAILLLAAFLRFFKLGAIPAGIQADEASIGYEAYSLAFYGVDRNGFAYPVYPITWGCGGGSPLMIYLNAISTSLFGSGIAKLRLIPAICGILTVFLFYFILKEAFASDRFSSYRNILTLTGTFFLAICPWHVILSRWSLDSNIMPFTLSLAVYLFIRGCRNRRTVTYVLSAVMFAVCMYSYGSATVIVPLTLVVMAIYCVRCGVMKPGQLIASIVAFIIVFAPLLVFYCVNYLGFPEIITGFVSVNRFTATRTDEVFIKLDSTFPAQLLSNLKTLLLILTVGDNSDMACHYIKGYATLYAFTFPITLIGLVISYYEFIKGFIEKEKKRNFFAVAMSDSDVSEHGRMVQNAIWVVVFTFAALFSLAINADISRMVMIFIPLVYFFVRGICFIYENQKNLFVIVILIFTISGASFTKDYFSRFNADTVSIFMPGYAEAIHRAYEVAGDDRQIYSTYDGLTTPYIFALYCNDYDPRVFNETVVYKDPYAEFRSAQSFGNFVFDELPEDVLSEEFEDTVFVVTSAERELFSESKDYVCEDFGGYFVVYRNVN